MSRAIKNNNNKENICHYDDSMGMPSSSVIPDELKATVYMRQSLNQLHSSLICPLCQQMLQQPSTLACAHTFCWKCIRNFSCNNSLCPIKGCGIPLSVTGSRKGSFLKINPSLETVLSSFQTICQTLDKAPTEWWKNNNGNNDEMNNKHRNDEDADMAIMENATSMTDGTKSTKHNNNSMETNGGAGGGGGDHLDAAMGGDEHSTASGSSDEEVINLNIDHSTTKSSSQSDGDDANSREGDDDENATGKNNWLRQINLESSDDDDTTVG